MPEQADGIWRGVASVAETPTAIASDLAQTEALAAAVALTASSLPAAKLLRIEVARRVSDPAVRALLSRGGLSGEDSAIAGELSPAPYGALLTALLTVTLLLFVISLLRGLLRLTLSYRRPAELRLSERGSSSITASS
jgi:hypothetical protein